MSGPGTVAPSDRPLVVLALHRAPGMEVPLRVLGLAVLARPLGAALQKVLGLSAREGRLPFFETDAMDRREALYVQRVLGYDIAKPVRPMLPVEGGRAEVTLHQQSLRGEVTNHHVRHVAVVSRP